MTGDLANRRVAVAVLAVLLALLGARPAAAQADPEKLRTAKALFFDRKYAEAREAWLSVKTAAKGADAETAAYYVARCSESLGENERSLKEYDAFLAARPRDRALAEEARTSRVTLAAKLFRAGRKEHAGLLKDALFDSSKTVRYYAGLQMSNLGPEMCRSAVPVLRKILAEEADADLKDRAKLALLRCDRDALPADPAVARAPGRTAHWFRLQIFERGHARPNVSISLPLGLAELLFKSLPDEVKADLRKEGYDADNFWERLRRLGPTEIIRIEGDDGERIQIWTE